MGQERVDLYSLILTAVRDMDAMHSNGIAVSEPKIIVPRDSIPKVYEEGRRFSGIVTVGKMESCLTPIPAPHVSSSIPAKEYLETARGIFGSESFLPPKYDDVKNFPPQVVLWWNRKNDETPYDFIAVSGLSKKDREDTCIAISAKCVEGVRLIKSLSGKPKIWGTWGYGAKTERELNGLTRGGPTIKEGHLHISRFDDNEASELKFENPPLKIKLNHYAPWNQIILNNFGGSFLPVIKAGLCSQLIDNTDFVIQRENSVSKHQNGAASIRNGFKIDFKGSVPLKSVISMLVGSAGRFEEIYQRIVRLHELYHKNSDPKERSKIEGEITTVLERTGFCDYSIQELARFIISVRPTYGQLLNWKKEMVDDEGGKNYEMVKRNIARYERFRRELKERNRKGSIGVAIVEDSVKNSTDEDITFTWPVHSSFCYVIDDYDLTENNIFVKAFYLYPEFVTTESAPERELGVVLRRQTLGSVESEKQKTLKIQKSLVRSESKVWILDGNFYKKMADKEIEAYKILSKYRQKLLDGASIEFPAYYGPASQGEMERLLGVYGDLSSDLHKISLLGSVQQKGIAENYGNGLVYSSDDFKAIIESLTSFRRIIYSDKLIYSEDYETRSIELIEKSRGVVDTFRKINTDGLIDLIARSEAALSDTAFKVAHRDLNWSNMGIVSGDRPERKVLQIVDWGTFGWAYPGYDEGRLMTRLCLNPKSQEIYVRNIIDFSKLRYANKDINNFLISFWRTVALRSYREIYLTLTGRYDRLIDDVSGFGRNDFCQLFLSSLETLTKEAMENLSGLLSN